MNDNIDTALVQQQQQQQPQQTQPLKQSKRINCSLDFLASIAQQTKLSDGEFPENFGPRVTEVNSAGTNLVPQHTPMDGAEAFANSGTMVSFNPDLAQMHAAAAAKFAEAAEMHASAALMMSGFANKDLTLKKSPNVSQVCGDNHLGEDFVSRGRRLQQNYAYRRRLEENGIHPIKRMDNRFGCSKCNIVFDKEMFIWRHGVKHLGLKPFQCVHCLSTFNRADSLQRHVRHFHVEGNQSKQESSESEASSPVPSHHLLPIASAPHRGADAHN